MSFERFAVFLDKPLQGCRWLASDRLDKFVRSRKDPVLMVDNGDLAEVLRKERFARAFRRVLKTRRTSP